MDKRIVLLSVWRSSKPRKQSRSAHQSEGILQHLPGIARQIHYQPIRQAFSPAIRPPLNPTLDYINLRHGSWRNQASNPTFLKSKSSRVAYYVHHWLNPLYPLSLRRSSPRPVRWMDKKTRQQLWKSSPLAQRMYAIHDNALYRSIPSIKYVPRTCIK